MSTEPERGAVTNSTVSLARHALVTTPLAMWRARGDGRIALRLAAGKWLSVWHAPLRDDGPLMITCRSADWTVEVVEGRFILWGIHGTERGRQITTSSGARITVDLSQERNLWTGSSTRVPRQTPVSYSAQSGTITIDTLATLEAEEWVFPEWGSGDPDVITERTPAPAEVYAALGSVYNRRST